MIKSIKRIITISICIFIIIAPLMCNYNSISYADNDDSWQSITSEKMWSAAVRTYIKYTRDFNNVVSSQMTDDEITKVITKFDFAVYKKACELLGVDWKELQRKTKYRVMTNGNIQFLYENSILGIYNSMWAKILEAEGLLDDENINQVVYSGKLFTDTEGNSCLIYVVNDSFNASKNITKSLLTYYGTPLKYTYDSLVDLVPSNNSENKTQFIINGHTYGKDGTGSNDITFKVIRQDFTLKNFQNVDVSVNCLTTNDAYSVYASIPYNTEPVINTNPHYSIFYWSGNNKYSVGIIHFDYVWKAYDTTKCRIRSYNATDDILEQLKNATIHAKREHFGNGPVDPSNGDDAILDTGTDDENNIFTDPQPPTPVNPIPPATQQPVPPDSVIPNPENPTINPGNPDFNFQMPDINIDWNLPFDVNNMPFPFSIPFDIKNFLEILDAEPIAPSYEFDFYILENHVEYEIDLSQFDDAMEIIRNIELAGYCIFLIISTRALFHIY